MSFPGIAHRLISGISMAVLLFTALFCLPDIGVPFILAALAAIMALEQVNDIEAFLKTLTGKPVDEAYIAKPTLPESGPNTPKADPS